MPCTIPCTIPSLRPTTGCTGHLHGFVTALFLCAAIAGSAQVGRFTIFKGGDAVGTIRTSRTVDAQRTSYRITSFTELRILLMQSVATTMTAEYQGKQLAACSGSTLLNGNMRDSSRMWTGANEQWAYVHPGPAVPFRSTNTWTTARMYYEEPVGQASILVESVLQDCPLRQLAPGLYELALPSGHHNRYRYAGGRLMEVQVQRPWLDLVFRRD